MSLVVLYHLDALYQIEQRHEKVALARSVNSIQANHPNTCEALKKKIVPITVLPLLEYDWTYAVTGRLVMIRGFDSKMVWV